MKFILIAVASAVRLTDSLPPCNGTNGVPGVDCELASQNKMSQYYLPTCTDQITVDCQPVCTETLTTGCTEARTPIPPSPNRFEGQYTHK